ncbi:MAG: tetratricopeptide repeat protein, partial [Endomicrobia bacterium]|nr:tetratricopeptide repeat protein [Endomicrobiia bacterium]
MKKIIILIIMLVSFILLFYKYIYSTGQFNTFLEKYPQSKYAQFVEYILGEIFFLINKYDSAMFRYYRVLEKYNLENFKLRSYYKIAECYEQKKDMSSALKIYKEIATKYPQTYEG